ncbi:MAG: transcriptional repressor NrdR [Lachnospiraceae bacterium]|nr:transcriptional repressor NrdR [Lachnospiraceae bacterium]
MKCPYCGVENTRVIDSRPADDGASIRRRRQCDACDKRFTTYEKVETIPIMIVKKDMTREEYNRSKIEAGIIRSCHKLPISAEQIKCTVDEIEKEIFAMDEKEIESKIIGGILIDKLKELNPVAYVRFASIYKEFKDVNTFMDEIKLFLDNSK